MKRACLAAVLALGVSGCNENVVCTEIGCSDGLSVTLARPPAGAFRVEAYVPPAGARHGIACSASPCFFFFPDFTPAQVTVAVITPGDTVTQEFTPTYIVSRPNGPGCDPVCRQAMVTFP